MWNMVLLLVVGVWFYGAWAMGSQLNSTQLGSFLPVEYAHIEKALALTVLLAVLTRVVLVK